MAELDIDALERKLEEAIVCVIEKGWRIRPIVTREDQLQICCPFGAVSVCDSPDPVEQDSLAYAAALLGLTKPRMWAFVRGFDGRRNPGYGALLTGYYALGRKFRERYVEAKS